MMNASDVSAMALLWKYRNVVVKHFDTAADGGLGAFYTEVDTPFDPQGQHVDDFIATTRQVIARYDGNGVVAFHLGFGLCEIYDVSEQVCNVFVPVVWTCVRVTLQRRCLSRLCRCTMSSRTA